jgi:hypothetical protein
LRFMTNVYEWLVVLRDGIGGPVLTVRAQSLASVARSRLARAQDGNLTRRYDGDAVAVARPKACGQALELGQGRQGALCVAALAPHRPRPITGLDQLHPGEDLLLIPAPSSAR